MASLSIQTVDYWEPSNFWVGPRAVSTPQDGKRQNGGPTMHSTPPSALPFQALSSVPTLMYLSPKLLEFIVTVHAEFYPPLES